MKPLPRSHLTPIPTPRATQRRLNRNLERRNSCPKVSLSMVMDTSFYSCELQLMSWHTHHFVLIVHQKAHRPSFPLDKWNRPLRPHAVVRKKFKVITLYQLLSWVLYKKIKQTKTNSFYLCNKLWRPRLLFPIVSWSHECCTERLGNLHRDTNSEWLTLVLSLCHGHMLIKLHAVQITLPLWLYGWHPPAWRVKNRESSFLIIGPFHLVF